MGPAKEPKAKRSRTRLGCFTCRDRHMKCDEQQPVCQNCINSKRKCYRGVRLNFTQYTIYNPRKAAAGRPLPTSPHFHRIIDQSIPVLQLYRNGAVRYKPYRHLHSPQDLTDATRLLQQDLLSSLPQRSVALTPLSEPSAAISYPLLASAIDLAQYIDPWLFPVLESVLFNFLDNVVFENYDIKSILMNPMAQGDQISGALLPDFSAQPSLAYNDSSPNPPLMYLGDVELELLFEQARTFIEVIHTQKFYWLLDLFNEFKVWKLFVPNYAVRLVQYQATIDLPEKHQLSYTLLFDCLLVCTESASLYEISAVAQKQLQQWREFDAKDVTLSSYSAFERILISIPLVSMALISQTVHSSFVVSPLFLELVAQQGRLYHKMAARFQRISEAKFRRMARLLLTVASFQAMSILRFFMAMRLRHVFDVDVLPITNPSHTIFDPLAGNPLTLVSAADVAEYFTIPLFEAGHLTSHYKDFDIAPDTASDAGKLRAHFWQLARLLQNLHLDPRQLLMSPPEPESGEANTLVLIPNQKCTALNVVVAYTQRLVDPSRPLAVEHRLEQLFRDIEFSLMPGDIKARWVAYFGWAKMPQN